MTRTPSLQSALLYLRDESVFYGKLLFPCTPCVGELVFNTSMSGYQEIITDPSYARQIVTFTYPHIGNTGINDEDYESARPQVSGVVVRSPVLQPSNYRATGGLYDWLEANDKPALTWVDTRAVTHLLRNNGAIDAAIVPVIGDEETAKGQARELLSSFGGLTNTDLAKTVSCRQEYRWNTTKWLHGKGYDNADMDDKPLVVVMDFGVKHNILRLLTSQKLRVKVVPAETTAEQVLALQPDGVLLANGPGDPFPLEYAVQTVRKLIEEKIPLFGICLGFQVISLAIGGKTLKMKFGHHGSNHPVKDLRDKRVYITSQNHGFMVDAQSLGDDVEITHRSLFDGSLQGYVMRNSPVMAFQGHPEASPGPHDIEPLFAEFAEKVKGGSNAGS